MKTINQKLSKERADFRSCIDLINILGIIIEQINEGQSFIHKVFLDLKKTFDLVNIEFISSPLKINNNHSGNKIVSF